MSGVRVMLNGVDVAPKDVAGDEGIQIVETARTEDNSGGPLKRCTGTLTFYGEAWQVIKTELIDHPEGKNRTLPIKVFDVCAGAPDLLLFEGVIRGDSLKWCDGDCHVETEATEDTEETRKMDCFRSTFVWDNTNGFLGQQHPKMVYCDELRPEWLQWVLLISSVTWFLIFILLYPVVVVISSVIDFLNNLGANIDFDGDPDTTTLQWWENLMNDLASKVIGCGRRHPSPLVRSYINNVCDICDLSFQSSILNNPGSDYWNMVYFNADGKKGLKEDDPETYIYENRPSKTGAMLLDDICPVFNAKWRIENGVLRMERRDKMQGVNLWVDTEQLHMEKRMVTGVCYAWEKEDKPAFFEIGYMPDALDLAANEAGAKYTEDVNWNDPYSPIQKGIRTLQLRFGAARFRNDGVEEDVWSRFKWYLPLEGAISQHDQALLLNKGLSANPKLLLWDGTSLDFALVRQYTIPDWPIANDYNWPLQLNRHNVSPHTAYDTDEANMGIYGRFHAIDDPRVIEGKGYTFEFEFEYTREHLSTRDLWKYVQLPYGRGQIQELTINPEKKSIFVTGLV